MERGSGQRRKRRMEGLQICVRMTDGISFSLSSSCLSNKGLIEGAEAPTRGVAGSGRVGVKDGKEAQRHAHLIVFHMSNPSSGFVPLVLPPARPTRVGSQSEMWMSSRLTVPGCFSSGLATNPTPRIPPSHRDHFLPRRGQLLPPCSV